MTLVELWNDLDESNNDVVIKKWVCSYYFSSLTRIKPLIHIKPEYAEVVYNHKKDNYHHSSILINLEAGQRQFDYSYVKGPKDIFIFDNKKECYEKYFELCQSNYDVIAHLHDKTLKAIEKNKQDILNKFYNHNGKN